MDERDDKDFAIEFGEYLAKEAEGFLLFFNRWCQLKHSDGVHELNDRLSGVQSAIYEFRKRAQKTSPGLKKRPVAWRVKDFADGWIIFQSEDAANHEVEQTGALMQGLYVRDGAIL